MPEEIKRRRSAKYEALDAQRRAAAEEEARQAEKAAAAREAAEADSAKTAVHTEPMTDTGGLRYRVGNENRGNARFGEAQRMAASQPNPVYDPTQMSGANQPVQAEPYYQSGAWARQPSSPWQYGAGGDYAAYEQPEQAPQVVYYVPQQPADPAPGYPPAQPVGKAQTPTKKKKKQKWILPTVLGSVAAVLAFVFLFVVLPTIQNNRDRALAEEELARKAAAVAVYDTTFCENVFVDGVDLSGMSIAQAREAVEQHSAENFAWSVDLTWNGETVQTVSEYDLGIHIDINKALEDAWNRGHVGDTEQRYADMEALKETPHEGYSVTMSDDTSRLDAMLALIAQDHYIPAQDATFAGFNPDATDPFTFNPEQYGAMLDAEGMKRQLEAMAENRHSGALELMMVPLAPAVTEESLRATQYALRGQSTTPISMTKSTEDRNNNIRRAFELVSGTVIQPGKQFSFNGIVGQRTLENGFFPAEEYVSGLHEDGIGGGVCQASTTIYQAAARANLQIDKRTPHSMAVNYTDYGKDATVYWWAGKGGQKIDFAFTNNTNYPIYIKAAVQSSEKNKKNLVCNVWIYGEALEPGVTYDLVTEEVPIPAPEPEIKRDKDAKYVLYEDEQYETQKAEEGTEVHRWLVKYLNKKEVERTELEPDIYAPKPQIIYVGTRKRPEN